VKKELRPWHDNIACDVCGRTILKGERTEVYLAPGGKRHTVCQLCFARAEHAGWIRESASGDLPARTPRADARRPLLGRLRRRREDAGNGGAEPASPEPYAPEPAGEYAELEGHEGQPPEREPPRSRPKDPRHVRAVPTTAEVKVDRALDLFNGSEHQRTISGVARTLGAPWVSAYPDLEAPSVVTIAVAWELSWYHFAVDLGDEASPVSLLGKGNELEELSEQLRSWNAGIDANGRLVAGVGSEAG
jgi:hypothetical protein